MDTAKILEAITDQTRAVFLSHIQGFNALTDKLLDTLKKRGIALIEDVCEFLRMERPIKASELDPSVGHPIFRSIMHIT